MAYKKLSTVFFDTEVRIGPKPSTRRPSLIATSMDARYELLLDQDSEVVILDKIDRTAIHVPWNRIIDYTLAEEPLTKVKE